MKPLAPFAAFLTFALVPVSCHCSVLGSGVAGSGVAKRETRAVEPFRAIEASGSVELRVRTGPEQQLSVEIDDNLLPHLVTEVRGGTLSVYFESGSWNPTRPIRIEATVAALERIELSGATSAEVEGLAGTRFEAALSGSSDLRVTGKVDSVAIESSGATTIDAHALEAAAVAVAISGSGEARVHARDKLRVEASGASSVTYRGQPKLELDISGAGTVEPEG